MRIKCAAIMAKDGRVYEGFCHGDILQEMAEVKADEPPVTQAQQGFVTECRKFVDRRLAAEIAFRAKQIPEMVKELFSEDLNYPSQRFPRKSPVQRGRCPGDRSRL